MKADNMQIRPATRQGVKPLIGLYSGSGRGKTFSSLLLARGFVGPKGRIVMIDTESGRGSLYADVIPGGYQVLELSEPFSPARYIEALQAAEQVADVIVADSMTHEWESIGGVQDMAMQVSQSRAQRYQRDWDGVIQFGDWKQPKLEHQKMMNKLLQCRCAVICCVRAKHKSKQVKGTPEMEQAGTIQKHQIGKSIVIKDDFCTPVQADDFINEMTVHGEILEDHSFKATKVSHPSLRAIFPLAPIGEETGAKLADWCAAPGRSAQAKSPKARLWAKLPATAKTGATKDAKASSATKWLQSVALIGDNETWSQLTDEQVEQVLVQVEAMPK